MAKIPESIDKYKIEGLIASGGMGAVYQGHPSNPKTGCYP
jgi:hypothetical protein